jgi:hypothetical protein
MPTGIRKTTMTLLWNARFFFVSCIFPIKIDFCKILYNPVKFMHFEEALSMTRYNSVPTPDQGPSVAQNYIVN